MPTWLWILLTVLALLVLAGAIGASPANDELLLEAWTRTLRIHHPGGKLCTPWHDVPTLLQLLDRVPDEGIVELCDAAGGSRLRLDKKTARALRAHIARLYEARVAAG